MDRGPCPDPELGQTERRSGRARSRPGRLVAPERGVGGSEAKPGPQRAAFARPSTAATAGQGRPPLSSPPVSIIWTTPSPSWTPNRCATPPGGVPAQRRGAQSGPEINANPGKREEMERPETQDSPFLCALPFETAPVVRAKINWARNLPQSSTDGEAPVLRPADIAFQRTFGHARASATVPI